MAVRGVFGRALHRVDRGGLILLYHRVAAPELDPQLLRVTPEHFAEHLSVLRRLGDPVALSRIRETSSRGRAPKVAVTFDDGYADNLLAAAPLLEGAAVPATVFVVSGLVGVDREFWWDELERVLLVPRDLPATLELRVGTRVVQFQFEKSRLGDPSWNVLREDTPSANHAAYRALMTSLRALDPPERDPVIDELRGWAGLSPGARSTHRSLDEEALRRLDACELVEVGAHTVGHPSLAALTPTRQREEVEGSKRRLEELLGRPVSSFSYPFGGPADYSRTTVLAVAEAGFSSASTTLEGRVGSRTDPFQLPRLLVRDWDGDEFEQRLREWMRL